MSKYPAARVTDLGTGHGCWPPNPIIEGASTVFINSKPAALLGSKLATHCCLFSCHDGFITGNCSPNVLVEGKPLARVTSEVSCGEFIMTGSSNVKTS